MTIRSGLVFDLMEHPYFQRLRRIKQLGLSNMVYPGANHSRFEHALGAVHLMQSAIDTLELKGADITPEEAEAVMAAILLHDIGHGPFSHTLEHSIVEGIPHEEISLMLMEELNRQFEGRLSTAIRIFRNDYPKKFLHQLVSSQLDMDRLDYLRRDSFYTGVAEGTIGSDRIIKMLNVHNDRLVVEAKGIYSIEQYLLSRRFMYWQVYLHKTVLSAEFLLINTLRRAKELATAGVPVFATPLLSIFLTGKISRTDFTEGQLFDGRPLLGLFAELDDNDILASLKQWQYSDDKILAYLAQSLITRRLFRVRMQEQPFTEAEIAPMLREIERRFAVSPDEARYFLFCDSITNSAYTGGDDTVNILFRDDKVLEISEASDVKIAGLSKVVQKFFICYPKALDIK
ncbi:MAG: HD domain-containing protein [Bacteroidales bacterium]|nr:HD domain-containing protein [Bacteroidales bacterium]